MKNDNDKWLESLRESLDGFEVEPHPGIWDSIERDTAAARRRPTLTVVWRTVAAAASFSCHHKNEDFGNAGFCRHSHTG